jgi:hypothetical protein
MSERRNKAAPLTTKVRLPIPARQLAKFYRLFDESNRGYTQRLKMWDFVASLYPKVNMKIGTWDVEVDSVWNVFIVSTIPVPTVAAKP